MSRLPLLPPAVAHAFGLAIEEMLQRRATAAGVNFYATPDGVAHARADGVLANGEAERALMQLPGCRHDGTGFVWSSAGASARERAS